MAVEEGAAGVERPPMRRIVIWTLAPVAVLSLSAAALPAAHDGQVCPPLDSGKVDTTGDPATVTVTAPDGYAVGTVCIKAGSVNQGNGPEFTETDHEATSVTLGHSSGKAVSHWSANFVPLLADPDPEPPDGPVDPTPPPPDEAPDPTTEATDVAPVAPAPAPVAPAPAPVAPAAAPVTHDPAFTG